jgi:hypothetical protein
MFVQTSRATTVPFTEVTTDPEQTPTGNATIVVTCTVLRPRR